MLHDLHAIDPEEKIKGRGRPLMRQPVEQGLQVVQLAFVEPLTEFPDDGTKGGAILLAPARVALACAGALAFDLAQRLAVHRWWPAWSMHRERSGVLHPHGAARQGML
jgi:hypothetical protein